MYNWSIDYINPFVWAHRLVLWQQAIPDQITRGFWQAAASCCICFSLVSSLMILLIFQYTPICPDEWQWLVHFAHDLISPFTAADARQQKSFFVSSRENNSRVWKDT